MHTRDFLIYFMKLECARVNGSACSNLCLSALHCTALKMFGHQGRFGPEYDGAGTARARDCKIENKKKKRIDTKDNIVLTSGRLNQWVKLAAWLRQLLLLFSCSNIPYSRTFTVVLSTIPATYLHLHFLSHEKYFASMYPAVRQNPSSKPGALSWSSM